MTAGCSIISVVVLVSLLVYVVIQSLSVVLVKVNVCCRCVTDFRWRYSFSPLSKGCINIVVGHTAQTLLVRPSKNTNILTFNLRSISGSALTRLWVEQDLA